MARVSTYLNFSRGTEQAFQFYKTVFKTEFEGDIARFKDLPPNRDSPRLPKPTRTWSCTSRCRS